MRNRPSDPSIYRDALFLSSCEPSQARNWFEARDIKISRAFGGIETAEEAHLLEYIVFRRNQPAFDQLLALHGTSATVLRRLYQRGNSAIRVSVCANSAAFCGEIFGGLYSNERQPYFFRDILERGTLAELRALCQCSNLHNTAYTNFLNSWIGKPDSRIEEELRISDARFLHVLEFLSKNKRVSQHRDETEQRHYWDGFAEYEYSSFFDELWRLAEIVPANDKWGYALYQIYKNLVTVHKPYEDIDAVLERWSSGPDLRYKGRSLLRTELAKKYKQLTIDDLENSDYAVRCALYQSFDPDHEDFIDQDYFNWHQRDNNCAYDIENNDAILKSANGRRKFDNLLWRISRDDHDMVHIGFWRERLENAKIDNPEWFQEDENDYELDYDRTAASEDYKLALRGIELANQNKVSREGAKGEALGRNVLQQELGEFGTKGLDIYNLEKTQTDRLIAHTRSDVAMNYSVSLSAFEQAMKATNQARFNTILCLIIIMILLYLAL